MKKIITILTILLVTFSCEDVIEVDLNNTDPRLVIDASINWFKGTSGNNQSIKLTLSAPYFDTQIPPANGALVSVFDGSGNEYVFIEDNNTGVYLNDNFNPVINGLYNLVVIYDGETYTASETLKSVAPFDYIEQKDDGGFSGEEIEIKAYFTDPIDEENYYFFEFIPNIPVLPTLDTFKDEFVNGNEIFGFYSEEDLKANDLVVIRNHGVSQRFYEYMFILLQQTGGNGGPFETQPASVRGNCVNTTNAANYPFGYFRLSEVDEVIYRVE